jgi:hypothetical protein
MGAEGLSCKYQCRCQEQQGLFQELGLRLCLYRMLSPIDDRNYGSAHGM